MPATVVCPITAHEVDVEATVRLAADLAHRHAATLSLVDIDIDIDTVSEPTVPVAGPGLPAMPLDTAPSGNPDVMGAVAADRRAELEGMAALAGHETVQSESLVSTPGRALRELSARPGTELMVVHDEGGGAFRSALVGNVGRGAMRDVRCPVVLSPPGCGGPLPAEPVLLCAIDDDDIALTVAAFAGQLAEVLDVPVHLVHAGTKGMLAPLRLERLLASCEAVIPADVTATFSTIGEPATEMLCAEAAAMEADLVIVGRPSHGSLASAITGSVAHELVHRGSAPVVIVPDPAHLVVA